MEKRTTVLITGVGSGVAQSIIKALKYANQKEARNYRLIGTDASFKAAGLYVVDKGHVVPYCDDPKYVPKLVNICCENGVAFIIPGTDPEVKALSLKREELEKETNAHVVINPADTIEIGYDKYKTSLFLKNQGFPYPNTIRLKSPEADLGAMDFPLIVKPRYGSGSVGLSLINDRTMLENHLSTYDVEMIAQEFIDVKDEEYTCGLAFGCGGELFGTMIVKRDLKKGFTQFARVVDQGQVKSQILEIARALKGRGSYNVQGRLIHGKFVVFEINPRFSGTTAFRAVAGMNEPDMYIQHNIHGAIDYNNDIKPLCMIRFLDECYFDPIPIENNDEKRPVQKNGFKVDYFID